MQCTTTQLTILNGDVRCRTPKFAYTILYISYQNLFLTMFLFGVLVVIELKIYKDFLWTITLLITSIKTICIGQTKLHSLCHILRVLFNIHNPSCGQHRLLSITSPPDQLNFFIHSIIKSSDNQYIKVINLNSSPSVM